jgi:signal transduction histidine kinase
MIKKASDSGPAASEDRNLAALPPANTDDIDSRLSLYIAAAEQLASGHYDVDVPAEYTDVLGQLGQALYQLARALESRYRQIQKLDQITTQINAGLLLDDVLDNVYRGFKDIIPYNRIGFALIENEGATVRARWATSDQPHVELSIGYEAPLAGSSLQTILETGEPRILNDLQAYLDKKPGSESTRLIVDEGIRSSLTCPLIANGIPIGFMFFSSVHNHAYDETHVETFKRIANQISVIVEKGRLVSELALQKEEIEHQNAELLHLNDLKNTLLGMVAHDLRNPISYIQMAADLILDDENQLPTDDRDRLLADMSTQAQHMLTLLNELLEVTRIESGKLVIQPKSIDLDMFLQEAVHRQNILAAPKETRVILAEASRASVVGDPGRLRQVIDNLLSNAVKYSPAGSTVTLHTERLAHAWKISVSDEGPGIKPQERAKLFQEFAKLSAQPTGGETSTGLGLAISKRIIEAHGGEIDVDSEPGRGATFWFTLPA